ncbi:PREDICTED: olfactory receptor 51B5-like, partial [Chlamydotis macqueenii]|uniref:olfactory receptor 51B5-like n=1 Tax=Chlamydotis macqueenii TaxID=187382 RepID=UPI0005297F74
MAAASGLINLVCIAIAFNNCYGFVAVLSEFDLILIFMPYRQLHQPMYSFLCMLSFSSLRISFSTLPAVLTAFCSDSRGVGSSACSAFHPPHLLNSGLLLAISHCFTATCNPPHHAPTLTGARVPGTGL